jgi:hypothetical protein
MFGFFGFEREENDGLLSSLALEKKKGLLMAVN